MIMARIIITKATTVRSLLCVNVRSTDITDCITLICRFLAKIPSLVFSGLSKNFTQFFSYFWLFYSKIMPLNLKIPIRRSLWL